MPSEVEAIEAALFGPVNNWLNNPQLLMFQRLVQIARGAERAKEVIARLQAGIAIERAERGQLESD